MVDVRSFPAVVPSANDRLKDRFRLYFWGSLAAAVAVHFLLLALWPRISIADVSIDATSIRAIEVPPEVEIPPPPEALTRPAIPVASVDMDLDVDLTITPNTFDANPVSELPPPPVGQVDLSETPAFTPFEVRPELRNRRDYQAALARLYPPMLRDAGIGGTVLLWVFIDESGDPRTTRVVESSGHQALDTVAERLVLEVAKFSPALNRDRAVAVWIQLPITFQTN